MDNKEIFLIPIVNKLESKLIEFGFGRAEKDINELYEILEWKRNRDWIFDKIKLVFPKNSMTFFYLTMSANLIVDEKEVILRHIPISYLRNSIGEYRFPMFFKKIRSHKFIQNVVHDTIDSLDWFDQFANKKECLILVESGKCGITSQGTLYPAILKILTQ